jgi:hypothetical protein
MRFLGASKEKIRALKAEDCLDERFIEKVGQERMV